MSIDLSPDTIRHEGRTLFVPSIGTSTRHVHHLQIYSPPHALDETYPAFRQPSATESADNVGWRGGWGSTDDGYPSALSPGIYNGDDPGTKWLYPIQINNEFLGSSARTLVVVSWLARQQERGGYVENLDSTGGAELFEPRLVSLVDGDDAVWTRIYNGKYGTKRDDAEEACSMAVFVSDTGHPLGSNGYVRYALEWDEYDDDFTFRSAKPIQSTYSVHRLENASDVTAITGASVSDTSVASTYPALNISLLTGESAIVISSLEHRFTAHTVKDDAWCQAWAGPYSSMSVHAQHVETMYALRNADVTWQPSGLSSIDLLHSVLIRAKPAQRIYLRLDGITTDNTTATHDVALRSFATGAPTYAVPTGSAGYGSAAYGRAMYGGSGGAGSYDVPGPVSRASATAYSTPPGYMLYVSGSVATGTATHKATGAITYTYGPQEVETPAAADSLAVFGEIDSAAPWGERAAAVQTLGTALVGGVEGVSWTITAGPASASATSKSANVAYSAEALDATGSMRVHVGTYAITTTTMPPPPPGSTVIITAAAARAGHVGVLGTVRQTLPGGLPPILITPPPVVPPPIAPIPGNPTVFRPITAAVNGTLLATAADKQWLDEYNGVGTGSIKVPAHHPEAQLLQRDAVVQLSYEGQTRFCFSIENRKTNVVGSPGTEWVTVQGRGLLGWLDDAVVYPAGGLHMLSFDERGFNFASKDVYENHIIMSPGGVSGRIAVSPTPAGSWGVRQGERDDEVLKGSVARKDHPSQWPDPDAMWIWNGDGAVSDVTADATVWYRKKFTVPGGQLLKLYVTGDNGFMAWIDGVEVAAAGYEDSGGYTWKNQAEVDLELSPGEHVIGLRGQNLRKISAGGNPAGILATLVSLKYGEPDLGSEAAFTPVRTGPGWEGYSTPTGWLAGDVLYTLVREAQQRNVTRVSQLHMTFNGRQDSYGYGWTTLCSRSWPVGASLLQVALDLCEMGLDIWVTPDGRLHCAETRGVTRRQEVVKLEYGKNLTTYDVDQTFGGASNVITRTRTGWFDIPISESRAYLGGRRETGMALQNAEDLDSAKGLVHTAIGNVTFAEGVAAINDTVPVDGAKPYVDAEIADIVTAMDVTGAPYPSKLLSISMKEDEAGVPYWTPEIEVFNEKTRLSAIDRARFVPRTPTTEDETHPRVETGGGDGPATSPAVATRPTRNRHGRNSSDYHSRRTGSHHRREKTVHIGKRAPSLTSGFLLWVDTSGVQE